MTAFVLASHAGRPEQGKRRGTVRDLLHIAGAAGNRKALEMEWQQAVAEALAGSGD